MQKCMDVSIHKEIIKFAGKWIDLIIIILSKMAQTQKKQIPFVLSCVNLRFKVLYVSIQVGASVDIDYEARKDTGRRKGGFKVGREGNHTCDRKVKRRGYWEWEGKRQRRGLGKRGSIQMNMYENAVMKKMPYENEQCITLYTTQKNKQKE